MFQCILFYHFIFETKETRAGFETNPYSFLSRLILLIPLHGLSNRPNKEFIHRFSSLCGMLLNHSLLPFGKSNLKLIKFILYVFSGCSLLRISRWHIVASTK